MTESKKRKVIYIFGAVGMFLFMIGDWLLDAAGAGDEEVGVIVHSNWPQMAMWRFVMSATLALVALLPVYFASADAIKTARANEALKATRASRFWRNAFCLGHILLMTYGIGFHIILCIYPMIFKSLLNLGVDLTVAADAINNAGMLTIGQLMFVYLISDIGVSIAWYYMILKRKLNLGKWALVCCPLSTLIIDFPLKAIPLQFFKDFTVAFESLGWLLMYVALAVMAAKMEVEKKAL